MTKRKTTKTIPAEQAAPTADASLAPNASVADETLAQATAAEPQSAGSKPTSKTDLLVELLRQPGGASIEAMMQVTGWQAHSVRGALSGAVKKRLGLPVSSEKTEAGRIYRLPAPEAADGGQV